MPPRSRPKPQRLIFISHSSIDRPLVKEFVNLLESGIGIPADAIFCSSLPNQGVLPGSDILSSLHEELDHSQIAIMLISDAFYASAFCMCELGAVWAWNRHVAYILVPPLDFNDLQGVIQ